MIHKISSKNNGKINVIKLGVKNPDLTSGFQTLYVFHKIMKGHEAGTIYLNWAHANNTLDELEYAIKCIYGIVGYR